MDRKRTLAWQYMYLSVTSLTFTVLFILSCATVKVDEDLLRSQMLLAKGDYKGALEENKKVLSRYPDRTPGDEALFKIGLIYAHLKDYKKSLESFRRLLKEFPQSARIEEAKIWTGVLNAIEEIKKVDIEIEEKKKELVR